MQLAGLDVEDGGRLSLSVSTCRAELAALGRAEQPRDDARWRAMTSWDRDAATGSRRGAEERPDEDGDSVMAREQAEVPREARAGRRVIPERHGHEPQGE